MYLGFFFFFFFNGMALWVSSGVERQTDVYDQSDIYGGKFIPRELVKLVKRVHSPEDPASLPPKSLLLAHSW